MSTESILQRLAYAENAITQLKSEVQRLSHPQAFQTSIPLLPGRRPYVPHERDAPIRVERPYRQEEAPMPLSEILQNGETVSFAINTSKDHTGNSVASTVLSTFDGTNLTVTECAAMPSLVGRVTTKPGEILFAFMNGLHATGIIQRTFHALPWRMASVTRDGQRLSLAQLRREKQDRAQ